MARPFPSVGLLLSVVYLLGGSVVMHAGVLSPAEAFTTPLDAARAGVRGLLLQSPSAGDVVSPCPAAPASSGFVGQCFSVQTVTLGHDAAVVSGEVEGCDAPADSSDSLRCSGAALFAYVVQTDAGWIFWDAIATQNGQAPQVAAADAAFASSVPVGTPGDCGNVRVETSLSAVVVACLPDQTWVRIDDGPVYAEGQLWWHIAGALTAPAGSLLGGPQGWMAHAVLGGHRLGSP